jgi:hypothetical protein
MKKLSSPFQYPIIIKEVHGMLTFSIPDFNIFLSMNAPTSNDLKKDYVTKFSESLGRKILQSWGKINEELKKHENAKWRPPEISKIKNTVTKDKKVKEIFTISDLVVILDMSENSIRRLSPQDLPYYKTSGGHRRYKKLSVEMFLIKMKENKLEKRRKSKLHSGLVKKLNAMIPPESEA